MANRISVPPSSIPLDKQTLTLISGGPPRILRHQTGLCGPPLLQSAQASPRGPVDRFGIDVPSWAPRVFLVPADRSSRHVVHADAPARGSIHVVGDDRVPRALVQAFRGYRASWASLWTAIDQLHVGDAPAMAPRGVRDQRVPRTARRRRVPVLGHQRHPGPGQRDQAVPRAPVVRHIRYQGVPRAQGSLGNQRVSRAVQHVRRQARIRDQTVPRTACSIPRRPVVVVRDQRVPRTATDLLVEHVPRFPILISLQQWLMVDALKGQGYILESGETLRKKSVSRNSRAFLRGNFPLSSGNFQTDSIRTRSTI